MTDFYQPTRKVIDKENFKILYERKLREEELRGFSKQTPMTPNPLLRNTKTTHNPNQNTESKFGQPGGRFT
jgi:hypothetical protein